MSGLLGFMAGAGDAFQDVADRRLKMYDTAQLEQMKQQAEIMKEQREEESAKRLGLFREQMDIRGEGRKLANDEMVRKQKMAEETDPEYIKRLATAETTKQGMLDAYKYGNADQEAAYKRKLALATDIDHTDYAGRSLEHELKRMQIEQARNPEAAGVNLKGSKVVQVPYGEGGSRDIIVLSDGTTLDPVVLLNEQKRALAMAEAGDLRDAYLKGQPKGEADKQPPKKQLSEEALQKQKEFEEEKARKNEPPPKKRTGAGKTFNQSDYNQYKYKPTHRNRTAAGKTFHQNPKDD